MTASYKKTIVVDKYSQNMAIFFLRFGKTMYQKYIQVILILAPPIML